MRNMIRSLLRWARVTRAGDDTKDFPVQQVSYLAKVGDTVMWFPYGMHANIPADELVLMVSMQGNPEARVSIPGSPQKRVKPLAASEVVFFHPDTGSKLHFKANGDIEITSVKDVAINVADNVTIDAVGNITINMADLVASGGSLTLNGTTEFSAISPKIIIGDGADDILLLISDILVEMSTHLHSGAPVHIPHIDALQARADAMRT